MLRRSLQKGFESVPSLRTHLHSEVPHDRRQDTPRDVSINAASADALVVCLLDVLTSNFRAFDPRLRFLRCQLQLRLHLVDKGVRWQAIGRTLELPLGAQ